VNGLIAQSPSGAWSSGAAILTFVFPMLLFIAVAGALYVLYTKPEVAPGHRAAARPISYTSVPGQPTVDASATPAADASATPAADASEAPAAEDGTEAAESSENAEAKGDE
jgi:hypothetical protein